MPYVPTTKRRTLLVYNPIVKESQLPPLGDDDQNNSAPDLDSSSVLHMPDSQHGLAFKFALQT